ncbi:MAG TPA: hypothetical protein PKG96_05405 [Bacilli bacterium]|nr:hypothetical protein [Bacilli bacterium]
MSKILENGYYLMSLPNKEQFEVVQIGKDDDGNNVMVRLGKSEDAYDPWEFKILGYEFERLDFIIN